MTAPETAPRAHSGALAPLNHPVFRADWIRPPKLVTRLVIQTARKTGWFSGASAPVRTRAATSGVVMARTGWN